MKNLIKSNIEHLKKHISIVNNQVLNLNTLIDKLKSKINYFENESYETYVTSEILHYKQMLEKTEKNLDEALKDMKNSIERLKSEQQKLITYKEKENERNLLKEKFQVITQKKEHLDYVRNGKYFQELDNNVLSNELKNEIKEYGEMSKEFKQKWENNLL